MKQAIIYARGRKRGRLQEQIAVCKLFEHDDKRDRWNDAGQKQQDLEKFIARRSLEDVVREEQPERKAARRSHRKRGERIFQRDAEHRPFPKQYEQVFKIFEAHPTVRVDRFILFERQKYGIEVDADIKYAELRKRI